VSSLGTLINSSGAVIGSSRTATGSYAIDFDVPVKGCAVSVTPTSTFMNVGANNPTGTTDRVAVFLRDIELHTLGNSQFTIVVTC
jgi:DNA/RNA endonuclease YhcR with UshA esterase domain